MEACDGVPFLLWLGVHRVRHAARRRTVGDALPETSHAKSRAQSVTCLHAMVRSHVLMCFRALPPSATETVRLAT